METEARTLTLAEQTNNSAVAEIYAALAEGNLAAFMKHLTPDVTWTVIPGTAKGGTYHGPRAVVEEALAPLAVDWADLEIAPFELTPAGDQLFVVGEYRGVYRATGKTGAARFVHVWHLRDGKVQRFETVFDTHTLWLATQR